VGSIFAMGIAPYITSSIIMQLLTVAIPKLEQIQKEGEEGRKKINQYTRVVAVALSFLQGGATVYNYAHTKIGSLFTYQNLFVYIVAVFAMSLVRFLSCGLVSYSQRKESATVRLS